VGYDRNSAQRTRVLDDQSDFFEVDANAWLTREVLAPHRHPGPSAAVAPAPSEQRIFISGKTNGACCSAATLRAE
jgi:hypothetical protein